MAKSIRRNIILNGLSSLISKGVRIADQLLLVPFFLSAWGAAYYGEWLTLTIVPSVLLFADLGFGTSACNAFVIAYSGGDRKKAADIYNTGIRLITLSVILGLLLTISVIVLLWSTGLLRKTLINPDDAALAIMLLMIARLITFYNHLFEAFYRSCHHAALSVNLLTIGGFLRIVASAIVLYMGCGIVAFAFVQTVLTLVTNSIYVLLGRYQIRDLPKGFYDKSLGKEIVSKGLAYLSSPIWQSLYYQGTTFIVRVVLGAETVAIFNTVRTVCRSVSQFYSVVNGAVTPEMQIAYGKGDIKTVQRLYKRSMRIELFLAISGGLLLLIVGKEVYGWWTHHLLDVPDMVWYIFIIGIVLNAMWWTSGMVFKATNQPHRYAVYCVMAALLSTGFTYILSRSFGLTGAAAAYLLLDVILVVTIIPTASRLIHIKSA